MKRLLYLLFIFFALGTKAQQTSAIKGMVSDEKGGSVLNKYMTAIDTLRSRRPVEKLYLQNDKNYYITGDTLWFKAYLLNGDFLTPSQKSGLLYVELDDAAGKMEKRIMVPVLSGVSLGNMELDEKEIPEGSYTLRAYTNWMRNFGEDYIFKKDIYISPVNGGSRLIRADFKLDSIAGKSKVQARLRFTDLNKNAIRLKDMQLRVINGRHNLFKDKASTGMDGTIDVNFDIADKTSVKNLSILANGTGKGADTAMLTIPVTFNRPENTDLQFMPEGGHLVAGIATRIGFKAIGEDGKSVAVSGNIYNSHQQEVTTFKSDHQGMGSLELLPKAGENYTAKVTLPNNLIKSYPLPPVQSSGTAIRIMPKGDDALALAISVTTDHAHDNYYLIGQSRGIVCFASHVNLVNGNWSGRVVTSVFPTGIARFTLFNSANQPLNERIVYIDHKDGLQLSVHPSKPVYTTRDSVALNIEVKDKDGKPVQGTFSMAVTDDSQVRTDSLGSNMMNDLLFTSDLKGTVEQPGWYLENNAAERIAALDDLLLTQGWVGYDWKDVFDTKNAEPKFPAEKEFTVEGKVTNVFNKPVVGTHVALIGKSPMVVKDTITGKDGIFAFKGLFPVDTAEFKLQAVNKNGKKFNIGIEMLNEFKPPVFAALSTVTPWYVNSDTVLINNANTKTAEPKAIANLRGEGHILKEVVIKDKKAVKDSQNLNGPGEADQVFDEQDMLKAGKMTLGKLLEEKVKGFTVKGPWTYCYEGMLTKTITQSYLVDGKIIWFVFDGIRLVMPFFNPEHYTYLKYYMDNYTAEDIKGIEVLNSLQFADKYNRQFLGGLSDACFPRMFIEITTRAGKGANLTTTRGTYLYKPLPFTLAKQFYSPKYSVKNNTVGIGTDLRSTIYWEPNVITDSNGKATISFFTADKPADYIIVLEGTDLNGSIGYKRKIIKVESNIAAAK